MQVENARIKKRNFWASKLPKAKKPRIVLKFLMKIEMFGVFTSATFSRIAGCWASGAHILTSWSIPLVAKTIITNRKKKNSNVGHRKIAPKKRPEKLILKKKYLEKNWKTRKIHVIIYLSYFVIRHNTGGKTRENKNHSTILYIFFKSLEIKRVANVFLINSSRTFLLYHLDWTYLDQRGVVGHN